MMVDTFVNLGSSQQQRADRVEMPFECNNYPVIDRCWLLSRLRRPQGRFQDAGRGPGPAAHPMILVSAQRWAVGNGGQNSGDRQQGDVRQDSFKGSNAGFI